MGDTPTCRLSAFLDEIRNVFVNSSNFLAWINSVDATETTAGHVNLGFDPRTVQKEEKTKGPNIFIFPENYTSENRGSAKTYLDTFDIVAQIVWFQSSITAALFINEINFICEIIDEFKAKGTALSTTFGGEVFAITSPDLVVENPARRDERWVEIRFSVRTGRED